MKRGETITLLIAAAILVIGISFLICTDSIIPSDAIELVILFVLGSATIIYANRTSDIANAAKQQALSSTEMATEMREQRVMASRPVIIQKAIPSRVILSGIDSDNFEVRNVGNGPAIELEILLLDKNKHLLASERRTFLRVDDDPITFHPRGLSEKLDSNLYLLCQYKGASTTDKEKKWYQTWLPFTAKLSQDGRRTLFTSGELLFSESAEKESF